MKSRVHRARSKLAELLAPKDLSEGRSDVRTSRDLVSRDLMEARQAE
jgi:hypothetical protein